MTERTLSIRAGLTASTLTPGMTAPDVSFTTPAMVPPSELWAHKATDGESSPNPITTAHEESVIRIRSSSQDREHGAFGLIYSGVVSRTLGLCNPFSPP